MMNVDIKFGDHYIIELQGCDPEKLKKLDVVKPIFDTAAEKSNATVIKAHYHQFKPEGVSGVILIAESHFTIHTWPDEQYAAVDIFTCGEEMDVEVAIDEMKRKFSAENAKVSKIPRGLP